MNMPQVLVCTRCGSSSRDFNRCEKCRRKFETHETDTPIPIFVVKNCNEIAPRKCNIKTSPENKNAADPDLGREISPLPEIIPEESKAKFSKQPMELRIEEAEEISKISPSPEPTDSQKPAETATASNSSNADEIQIITVYPAPPMKGGITINTADYQRLGEDQFLNDVIIDFYLKYLTSEVLSPADNARTHVFSSYFYTKLISPLAQDVENTTSPSMQWKRHERVKKWTKNVNIFEKEFVIIPINEHAHWFLAIICFPGLVREKMPEVERGDEEMEVGSDGEAQQEEIHEVQGKKINKIPCILVFDSMSGNSRSRVVATLREYLQCEYETKMGTEKIFSKDTIKCNNVKVPQQSNYSDCGLYVLQYVESFFKAPIQDFKLPIKTLENWFEEIVVTRKREELSQLLIKLMEVWKGKNVTLPSVVFPTRDGEIKVEQRQQSSPNLRARSWKRIVDQSSSDSDYNNAIFQPKKPKLKKNESPISCSKSRRSTKVVFSISSSSSSSVESLSDYSKDV